mmetsp:Transcript_8880/g.36737  ORF Transcript_8880/g.36737 Transcript_8880/m.36737 type:complete len:200 (+) Transcript_8880:120-719(+)
MGRRTAAAGVGRRHVPGGRAGGGACACYARPPRTRGSPGRRVPLREAARRRPPPRRQHRCRLRGAWGAAAGAAAALGPRGVPRPPHAHGGAQAAQLRAQPQAVRVCGRARPLRHHMLHRLYCDSGERDGRGSIVDCACAGQCAAGCAGDLVVDPEIDLGADGIHPAGVRCYCAVRNLSLSAERIHIHAPRDHAARSPSA